MAGTPRPGAVVVGTGFGSRVHVPALRAAGFDVVAARRPRRGPDAAPRRPARRATRPHVTRRGALDPGRRSGDDRDPARHPRGPRDRGGESQPPRALREAVRARRRRSAGHARRGGGRRCHAPGRSRVPLGERPGDGGSRHRRRRHRRTALRDVRVVRAARRRPGRRGTEVVVRRRGRRRLARCVRFPRRRPDPGLAGGVRRGERTAQRRVGAHRRRRGLVHDPVPPAFRRGGGAPADRSGLGSVGRDHARRGHRRHRVDRGRRGLDRGPRRCPPPRGPARPGPPAAARRARRPPPPLHAPRARALHPALRGAPRRGRRPAHGGRGAGPDLRRRPGRDGRPRRRPPVRRVRRRDRPPANNASAFVHFSTREVDFCTNAGRR